MQEREQHTLWSTIAREPWTLFAIFAILVWPAAPCPGPPWGLSSGGPSASLMDLIGPNTATVDTLAPGHTLAPTIVGQSAFIGPLPEPGANYGHPGWLALFMAPQWIILVMAQQWLILVMAPQWLIRDKNARCSLNTTHCKHQMVHWKMCSDIHTVH